MATKVVVIGGFLAGLRAVRAIQKLFAKSDIEITIVEKQEEIFYSLGNFLNAYELLEMLSASNPSYQPAYLSAALDICNPNH